MRQNLSSLTNLTHQYKAGDGNKRIKISNSLASINVVGNNENNKIKDQLVEFNSGEYLQTIEENCFKDCSKLKNVILQTKTNRILKNAFKNCTSLSSINIESIIFNTIEDSAFENIGIKDIQLKLFKQHDGTFGTDIFKSCKKLETVALTANYIPAKLFNDCTSLTSIYLTLSSVDGSMPYIDPDALYNIPSLTELTISGEFDAAPILSGFQQLNKVTIESNSNVQLNDKIFNNTPKLTQIDLSKCIRSIQQLSLNAFAGSSLKQITISAFSKTDLENSMLSYNAADKISWNKVVSEIIKTHEPDSASKKFYYGRLYSDVPELIEFALANALPFMVINMSLPFGSSSRYEVMSCKLLYEYLAQLPCLIGIVWRDSNKGSPKISINDIYDYYQGDEWDSKMLNPYAEKNVKNVRQSANASAAGSVWSCGYSGRNVIEFKCDGTTTIEYYKNGIQATYDNAFVYHWDKCNIPTTIYKFYNSTPVFRTHTLKYDILQKKIIPVANTRRIRFWYTQHLVDRHQPFYSNEWPEYNHAQMCLCIPYVIDYNLNKNDSYQLECSAKAKYNTFTNFYNRVSPACFYQKQHNVNKLSKSLDVFSNVDVMTIKNSTFILEEQMFDFGNTFSAIANGEDIDDNNVKSKSEEIQKAFAEYKQTGYGSTSGGSGISDEGIKNRLYKCDFYMNKWLRQYTRNSSFNAPDYNPSKVVDFTHKASRPTPANCWAINHDCTIIVQGNTKVKWVDKTKKFS